VEFDEEPELAIEFYYNEERQEKGFLTINTFRGNEYFHLRKYYMDFEGEFMPTNQGVSFPATLQNTVNLFDALCSILEKSEVLHTVLENSDNGEQILNFIAGRADESSNL